MNGRPEVGYLSTGGMVHDKERTFFLQASSVVSHQSCAFDLSVDLPNGSALLPMIGRAKLTSAN